MDKIAHFFSDKLHLNSTDSEDNEQNIVLTTASIGGIVEAWHKGYFKQIVVMSGAGISTNSGIPDFRSPTSGLYHNLEKYNLPYPEAIFELDYFRENPQPFFRLAKEIYPGTFKPTPSHYFIKLLQNKGLLLRHYTQNIDTLERIAGIETDKLVECHGTFHTNHCVDCSKEYSAEWVKDQIFSDNVPTCTDCNGIVKPDIVFFGENLPERFYVLPHRDFKQCDLLIIMGTSLTVQPFASLIDFVSDNCVRLLINREKVGKTSSGFLRSMMFGEGLCFDLPGNKRDVAYEGDCDDGCMHLADQLGFGDELRELVKTEHERIDKESGKAESGKEASDESKESSSDEKAEDEESKEQLLKKDEKPAENDVKSSI